MQWLLPKLFVALGVCFFLLGFGVAVGALARLQFGGGISWFFLAHAGMYASLGLGVFMRAKWLLPALLLNLGGVAVLYGTLALQGESIEVTRLLTNLGATGVALLLVYASRETLIHTQKSIGLGALFLALWILSYLTALLRVLG